MFVVKRKDAYVADVKRTGGASYTRDLAKAMKWSTREAAQAEACGNEYVEELEGDVGPGGG